MASLSAYYPLPVVAGTTAGTYAEGNDPRLSDARTPTLHKTTHAISGSDVLTPADIGAAAASHTHDAGTDITSGTLADARLSSNVPLLDAANTYSANQTLDGTNNVAPNQTAASGSSIMTRALVDSKLTLRDFPLHPKSVSFFTYPVTTTASASGGGGGAAGSGYRASSSTTNGSRGVVRLAAAASQLQPIFTLLDWSKPIIFGAKLSNVEVDFEPDKVQRIIWGASIGYTHDDPTNLCVGFRFENGTVFGFCHDGTTYTEPVSESTILPALRAVAQRSYYSVFITSDGAGNIEWFVDGASIGTSSAGPSTVGGTNQSDIAIQAQSNATLTSQNLMPAGYFYIAQP
jgi:hypothetical protein